MAITRDIYVTQNAYIQPIDYVQSTNAIPLYFRLVDFTLTSAMIASVYVTRKDQTVEFDNATIDTTNNLVMVDVQASMFSVVGESELQIRVVNGTDLLVSFDVKVLVSKNAADGGSQSTNVLGVVTDAVNQMNSEVSAAASSATAAAASAAEAKETLASTVKSVNGYTPNTSGAVTIPEATTSKSGVMSAADKTQIGKNTSNIATIEASTTASKAYAVGSYLVLNGQLYKVTAAIASGGTITVGTNVSAVALADQVDRKSVV